MVFEYGPRVGCWRLLRIFKRFDVKISILGVVRGSQLSPELTRAFIADGHEIVSHGWRWIDYHNMDEKAEREHIRLGVEAIRRLTGEAAGRLVQRPSEHQHAAPAGGARRLSLRPRLISATSCRFWTRFGRPHHLVIPYSLETNDNRFDRNPGFSTADDFARYMIDAFDLLYEEGAERPKLMSIGLHDRLIGRPGQGGRADQVPRTMRAATTGSGSAPGATLPSTGTGSTRRSSRPSRASVNREQRRAGDRPVRTARAWHRTCRGLAKVGSRWPAACRKWARALKFV